MRNILWAVGGGGAAAIAGGFTREDFMNEAFIRMTAAEQVVHQIIFSIATFFVFMIFVHLYSILTQLSFVFFFPFPPLGKRLIFLLPRQVTYPRKVSKFMV